MSTVIPQKRSSKPLEDSPDDKETWEGHHDYMRMKRKKLRSQALGEEQKSDIFEGVTIYVNGYTNPSADQLKESIHLHGGLYEHWLSSRVTHVIATNLPTAKIRHLRHSEALVCKPEWIVDSIRCGKRLSVDDYLLYSNQMQSAEENQKKITSFQSTISSVHEQDRIRTEQKPTISSSAADDKSEEFVNEFYTHSRLHYLSTWSRELKEFTSRMLPTAQQIIPRLDREACLRGKGTRIIVHVDADCFFVSVSLLDKPHLKGKPVAVTHAKNHSSPKQHESNAKSMSDIASCSYEAREAGVKNGMFVSKALEKCPQLFLVPYNFEKCRSISQILYEILISYSHQVEAVSCDEAYIELTDYVSSVEDSLEIVERLRSEVYAKTGCTVSAGISHNILLARIATGEAKPNGQFYLSREEAKTYLKSQPVRFLPGIGPSLSKKLQEHGIEYCEQLQLISLEALKEDYGVKTGEMLYHGCRGVDDDRELKLTYEKKSLSVDINFGIRFKEMREAEKLLMQLSKELEDRLKENNIVCECICLKLKVRKATASKSTGKFLGHGPCDTVTRSVHLLMATQDATEIGRYVCHLLKQIKPVITDIRGVGIQLTKLQTAGANKPKDIRLMLATAGNSKANSEDDCQQNMILTDASTAQTWQEDGATSTAASLNDTIYKLPPIDELDHSVLLALPPDIQDKILNEYSSKSSPCKKQSSLHSEQPQIRNEQRTAYSFEVKPSITSQRQYVDDLRNNLRKWVSQSPNGPSQAETNSFCKYLEWLTATNEEVLCLALKCLRRSILSKPQSTVQEWANLFNTFLDIVHCKMQTLKLGFGLDISPISV